MAGRRVLVVDDTPGAAKITAKFLELLGHTVEIAYTGQAAIEQCQVFRPEIVMLDVTLPDIDGFEVARQMRLRDETKDALIVALTGHDEDSHRAYAQAAGINEYLLKPVDVNSLRRLADHPKLLVTTA